MTPDRARGVRAELRYFFVALGYFTRVPVPRAIGYAAGDLDQAARYFPLVGACVGAWGALVYLAALRALPPSIAVGLSMAATLLATGAFHEDGRPTAAMRSAAAIRATTCCASCTTRGSARSARSRS